MPNIRARARIALAILAFATLPIGAAFAGEGGGPSFPGNDVPNVSVLHSAGLAAPGYAGSVEIGGTLPPVSNGQGEPEPVNSLPPGFEDGTPAMQHRQALHKYWEEHASHNAG